MTAGPRDYKDSEALSSRTPHTILQYYVYVYIRTYVPEYVRTYVYCKFVDYVYNARHVIYLLWHEKQSNGVPSMGDV